MGDLNSSHIKDIDRKILVKPEVAVHLDISGLKTLQKTATKGEREEIRTTIGNMASGVIMQNKQGQSIVPDDKQKQSVKRTAEWLNGPQGGNEF